MEFIETKSLKLIKRILKEVQPNNLRYKASQFQKLFECKPLHWIVGCCNAQPKAMLAFKENFYGVCGAYVCEVQSFESGHGYGRSLLEHMAEAYGKVWLIADWEAGESLLSFYRQIPCFRETVLNASGKVEKHVFSTKECSLNSGSLACLL